MRKWSFVKKVISESRILENRTEARPKIWFTISRGRAINRMTEHDVGWIAEDTKAEPYARCKYA